jgi:hypothetical protein
MILKTKAIALDLKSLQDDGTFSGYCSVFGTKDAGGDIVVRGAFTKSLDRWKESGRSVPVLWQHKTHEPIGDWISLEEDDHGLLGKAQLWIDEAPYARIAYKGMKRKTITGLSMGYRVVRESFDTREKANLLHEVNLAENSVVTDPMHDHARVIAAKSISTIREFEDFLRDEGGYSAQRAKAIASRGWGAVDEARDESDEALSKTLEVLTSFKLNPST